MDATDDLAGVELELREKPQIVVPLTAEIVDLRDPSQVAVALESVRDAKRQLDKVREFLEKVLCLESRRQGTKTLHLRGLDAVISGGERVEYDENLLMVRLRAAGCPEDRIDEAVSVTVKYKVSARVLKQLSAANHDYALAIASTRRVEPTSWRVDIKR